jgi:hypothetical protein
MADRYWVGGAGTWDATTTTNWSATSGGAGGASAPTSADNVIFDTLSNLPTNASYAVTVGTNANALDITIAGPAVNTVTITSGATAVINCYGSWTNAATGVVFTGTTGAAINFLATTTGKTITTNSVTLSANAILYGGVGGGWTLGSAFTSASINTFTNGAFSTANFAMTVNSLTASGAATRSISLGSSTITCNAATFINFSNVTGLTFNAGTSTINGSSNSGLLNGGGVTFYNVSFTGVTALTHTIQGANTFNNLTFTSRTTDGVGSITISANQTISGTLTLGAANTAVRRFFVRSDTIGTQRTLTVATIATLSDVDFQDTVAAGASGTWSGTRLGNCTNNSNITFAAGTNKYWNLAGAQNWSATGWATSSGGAPAVNNFPLAQDTAIFDNTGSVTGTITIQIGWALPAISITKTGAMTLASGTQTPRIFGLLLLQAATVTTGTVAWTYAAYGVASTFTSNTATFTPPLTINAPTGTVTLADGFTQPSTVTTTLTAGTLDLNGFTLSTGLFTSAGTNTLAFGTGNITLTGTGTIFTGSTTTTVTGTPQVICTDSSATARTLAPTAVTEANSISFRVTAGTGTLSLGTAPAYRDLDFTDGVNPTGYAGALGTTPATIYGNFKASTGMSQTAGANAITFAATSGTKTINTAGVTFDRPFTFNGVGGTFQLASALTSGATRTCTLTTGTLDLNGYTLTIGLFASNNGNTRAIAFGTGKFVLTGNTATVWTNATATGFSYTGTSRIEAIGPATTGTRTFNSGTVATSTEATALSFYITGGSDTVTFSATSRRVNILDFTGFTGTFTNSALTVHGNYTLAASPMVVGAGTEITTFATTTSQNITTNAQTLDFPVTFDGIGGSWAMQDALTLGSTQPLTLTNGTVKLKSGTTNTVGSFVTTGTNQKFLSATTPGSQATLSDASGTNSVTYLTIQDSNATGGAVWNAYDSTNVNAGNNTGWNFTNAIVETATGADTVTSIVAFFGPIQEAATGSDAVVSLAAFSSVIDEITTGTDAVTTTANFGSSIIETAISADTPTAAAAFATFVVDSATGSDAITARPIWEVIDDTQTANWTVIPTT